MKVIKFGGSSLASSQQLQKVLAIVEADQKRKYVIVSAPGKRFDGDTKVTDLLIQYARQTIHHQDTQAVTAAIIDRYAEIGHGFNVPEAQLTPIFETIRNLPKQSYADNTYLMAAFKAHGERLNAQLVAAVFQQSGLNARYLDPKDAGMVVTDVPDDAQIIKSSYDQLAKWANSEQILVIPGFFAYNRNGQICTFSRGGSDITGAIIARGVHAERYENFTDVDAIYAVNPSLVAKPAAISEMTFTEMRELSYAGFSVFHDEALIPAIEGNITVNVKNTNHPEAPGTLIQSTREPNPHYPVTGIASSSSFCSLYLRKYLLNKEVGLGRKILTILENHHISYEHMPSGIDDLTIIFDEHQLTPELEKTLVVEISAAINPDEIYFTHDYSILMLVGENMRNRVGIMSRAATALANDNIKLIMVNQGASEISIMFGVHDNDADQAVIALYKEFFD
ncbi:aspartate kinase [Lactiplantibacillus plantarum]|uniref:aspartate kinase n=1 Tax=Lactiplantibacillus plantarum TaxID=1590 RepID=UPI001D074801|nr:aspartate kinase [Lactiplantibacillus plantarum]MCB7138327.1 aspartate kinase [Lactiplantibacillus plantarum]MCB7150253.1 aspartate kinase [Lactiplantibacillus plantarum]MCB7156353.1 aspartate kinase [Lactiplantibacillus plantarum]MCB7163668.1 aspartate kinase [Lactiplantibacillus plantarum]MCB7167501.1 aspartate kinase [Lactiplantibacillus plantarum]